MPYNEFSWDELRYFWPREFDEPDKMNPTLLWKLEAARSLARIPFIINSSYRSVSDTSHGRGNAVDIRCRDSFSRMKIVQALLSQGIKRIGIYDRHIHADVDPIEDAPQNVMWWGQSR